MATGYFREVAPSTQKDGNGVKVTYTVVEIILHLNFCS
ncbi:hypothetical protein [Fusobacterium necrophorum]